MSEITVAGHHGKKETYLDPFMLDKLMKDSGFTTANPELIMGVELEIEGWGDRENNLKGWTYHEDGSLRNQGAEWVSAPTRMKYLDWMISNFFKTHKITADNYSERTSTHFHVNCLNLTLRQVASILLVYQTVERLLFHKVGNDRDMSIFCVPWYQAGVAVNLSKIVETADWRKMQRWQKYTALNILPIATKGTIEYRHLHGTCDMKEIMDWANIIACIHTYGANHPPEQIKDIVKDLNSSSSYDGFLAEIFGGWASLLCVGDYRKALEQGVIDSKLMILDEDNKTSTAVREEELDDFDVAQQEVQGQAQPRPARYAWNPAPPVFVEQAINPQPVNPNQAFWNAPINDEDRAELQRQLAALRRRPTPR